MGWCSYTKQEAWLDLHTNTTLEMGGSPLQNAVVEGWLPLLQNECRGAWLVLLGKNANMEAWLDLLCKTISGLGW